MHKTPKPKPDPTPEEIAEECAKIRAGWRGGVQPNDGGRGPIDSGVQVAQRRKSREAIQTNSRQIRNAIGSA